MKLKNCLTALITVIVVISSNLLCTSAQSVDTSQSGTINIAPEMSDGKAFPSGDAEVRLYHVAALNSNNGVISYALTDEFNGCGINISSLTAENAQDNCNKIMNYAAEKSISPFLKGLLNSEHKITFNNLPLGMYIVSVSHSALNVNPFFIALPSVRDGAYIYTVDAVPKAVTSGSTTPGGGGGGGGSGEKPKPQEDEKPTEGVTSDTNEPYGEDTSNKTEDTGKVERPRLDVVIGAEDTTENVTEYAPPDFTDVGKPPGKGDFTDVVKKTLGGVAPDTGDHSFIIGGLLCVVLGCGILTLGLYLRKR